MRAAVRVHVRCFAPRNASDTGLRPGVGIASLGIRIVAMDFRIDDRDLSAFLVYAARERSLDASLRAATKYGRSDEHRRSIDALRELNKKMLFRETRRDAYPF
ncbi:MAG TPA: hypothetical protein VGN14_14170 [Candidatus Elarobacter sp.]